MAIGHIGSAVCYSNGTQGAEEEMKEFPETHQHGIMSLENKEVILAMLEDYTPCDFGLQVAKDGRVWVCVNGVAFIRFKPTMGVSDVKTI